MSARVVDPGKLPPALLGRLLASLPPLPSGVRLGPTLGEDACAIDVGEHVLVAAADPITLTSSDVGRFSVIVNANDVAVCGARPRWFLATVLLPVGTTDADVDELFAGLRAGLDATGVALVGGHTEVTSAVNAPVVAGTMLGVLPPGVRLVTTGGAQPGDAVVQIGLAPVEGAAVLAPFAGDDLPEGVLAAALRAVDDPGISVVDAALLAAECGATSLHDPTEGGLASGLHELAGASGAAVHVDRSRINWFAPGRAVCEALGADPLATLASGCVIATFDADNVEHAVGTLASSGHPVAIIGRVARGRGVLDEDGAPLAAPPRDEVARIVAG